MMQYLHVCSPGGSSMGDTQHKQLQVEVDRLAAAPRKTLNRNPAGKIACSKLSQGGQTGLAYDSSTCSRSTWRYPKIESQQVGDRLRLLSTEDWS